MSRKPDVDGAHKVAALLLSLDKEASAQVLRHLDERVVAKVARAMTELDPELCTSEAVDALFEDLARTILGKTGVRAQDDAELFEILQSTFGPQEAERVIREIHGRRHLEQPFRFLDAVEPSVLAPALAEETPAVAALVLAHVSPAVSAEVLSTYDEERSLEVVKRMTTILPPGADTMLAIADDLRARLDELASMPPPLDRTETLRTVADMLNYSDTETERTVLEGLEEQDAAVAKQVRDFMFTWDDLASIDKRAMQKILASVDTRTLCMALKACSPEIEQNILSNLSSRVRDMVADERELAGAVPFREVLEARNDIMLAVRALMDAGEFSPQRAGEELVT